MIDFKAFLSLDRVAVVDELPSRKTALHQLAELLATGNSQTTYRDIFFKLEERERQGSTVLDDSSVAIPHCRIEGCPIPIGSLLKTRASHPVDFGGDEVRLMIGMCFPQDATDEALEVLRLVVRLIEDEERLKQLLAADSSDVLFDIFSRGLLAETEA